MKYPEDWDHNEIHYYETGEVYCLACYEYYHETLIQDGLCPDCLTKHEENEEL